MVSSTMFSSLVSEKIKTAGHCTVQKQRWPADANPTAVHYRNFLNWYNAVIYYRYYNNSQETQTWSTNHIMQALDK